jgi:protein TonB
MRAPIHAINGRREMTPERIVGIGFVGLLHVIAIWAIVVGLIPRITGQREPPPIQATLEQPKQPPIPVKPIEVPQVELKDTTQVDVPPPIIDIQQETTTPVTPVQTANPSVAAAQPPATPDAAASAIGSTHTTPPYPSLARKLGEQGQVQLRLTISPQGIVTAAQVVKTSGFADLDQAAVSWVLANWKYRPATAAGSPVASSANATVVFNLKNAR